MEEGVEAEEDGHHLSNAQCELPVLEDLVTRSCRVASEPLAGCLKCQLSILLDLRIRPQQYY